MSETTDFVETSETPKTSPTTTIVIALVAGFIAAGGGYAAWKVAKKSKTSETDPVETSV